MKVLVGLGNPDRKYQGTRHNVGFAVLDELAGRHNASRPRRRFEAKVREVDFPGESLLLVAPQTYMNASGRTAQALVRFFRLDLGDLLVVCDDINLPLGVLRLRRGGSSGGQKGLQNVITQLGTQEFARLRIGVGRPPVSVDAIDHVLSRFRPDEVAPVQTAIRAAADGVEVWIRDGLEAAMNRLNARSLEG